MKLFSIGLIFKSVVKEHLSHTKTGKMFTVHEHQDKRTARMTPEEIEIANRTSRTSGAIGAKAVVPRYVTETSKKGEKLLDFGAGKDAAHAQRLRGEGHDVTAHEFGNNQKQGLHDQAALTRQYDTVYASNVLNVQSSPSMMNTTLEQIAGATKPGGRAVFNFPKEPRKMNIHGRDFLEVVKNHFGEVKRVGGTADIPLIEARKPKTMMTIEKTYQSEKEAEAVYNRNGDLPGVIQNEMSYNKDGSFTVLTVIKTNTARR